MPLNEEKHAEPTPSSTRVRSAYSSPLTDRTIRRADEHDRHDALNDTRLDETRVRDSPSRSDELALHSRHPRLTAPLGRLSSDFGFGMMDAMLSRMERLMHERDPFAAVTAADDLWSRAAADSNLLMSDPHHSRTDSSSSYTTSTSTFSQTGPDGATESHSSRTERRRVGDLEEELEHWRDCHGNERTTERRGLHSRAREIVRERNARGEERAVENLRGLRAEEVPDFERDWNTAASARFDPTHSAALIGGGASSTYAPALRSHAYTPTSTPARLPSSSTYTSPVRAPSWSATKPTSSSNNHQPYPYTPVRPTSAYKPQSA